MLEETLKSVSYETFIQMKESNDKEAAQAQKEIEGQMTSGAMALLIPNLTRKRKNTKAVDLLPALCYPHQTPMGVVMAIGPHKSKGHK